MSVMQHVLDLICASERERAIIETFIGHVRNRRSAAPSILSPPQPPTEPSPIQLKAMEIIKLQPTILSKGDRRQRNQLLRDLKQQLQDQLKLNAEVMAQLRGYATFDKDDARKLVAECPVSSHFIKVHTSPERVYDASCDITVPLSPSPSPPTNQSKSKSKSSSLPSNTTQHQNLRAPLVSTQFVNDNAGQTASVH